MIFCAETELRTVVKKRVGICDGSEEDESVEEAVESDDWIEERMPDSIAVPNVPVKC